MPRQIQTTQTTFVPQKNMLIAYILWFFLGQLGIHRFYLRKTGTAVTQLLFCIIGYITLILVVGWFLLAALWVWMIVDIFLIPGLVRQAGGTNALFQTTTTTVIEDDAPAGTEI